MIKDTDLHELALTVDEAAMLQGDRLTVKGWTYVLNYEAQTLDLLGKRGNPLANGTSTYASMHAWMLKRQNRKPLAQYYQAEIDAGLKDCKPDDDLRSIEACRSHIAAILADPWTVSTFGKQITPNVTDGRGCSMASYEHSGHRIRLPIWARNRYVILHELAHALGAKDNDGHGSQFKQRLLKLVAHFIGRAEADALHAAYRARNCRVPAKVQY